MKVVLTGSLGQIGKHLVKNVIKNGNDVTVITSNKDRVKDIESMGAEAAVGSMFDSEFLSTIFMGADVVYLMETMEAAGDMFDKSMDLYGSIQKIGEAYKCAVLASGVKEVIHLSSVGANMDKNNGILKFHYMVETILRSLPDSISIKFIRPVGFFTNMYQFIQPIKNKNKIISNYGGDQKEPWVHPIDIADVIAEEIQKPFSGRTIRYVASDLASPNEVAKAIGAKIGKPDLQWLVIPNQDLLSNWLDIGFNKQVAEGFVEMQASMGNGRLYEDYFKNAPVLGKIKLADFAEEFAEAYRNEQ